MTQQQKKQLSRAFAKYKAKNPKKKKLLAFFRAFMPEIIFRTTKLEGESVTRKKVSSLFH